MIRLLLHSLTLAVVVIVGALLAQVASAQQLVVDDAGVTDPGACQIEAWFSESAGWVLPACTPISHTEISLGIGLVREAHGDHTHDEVAFVVQTKVNLLSDDPGRVGVAIVAGVGSSPFAQSAGERVEEFFAYVPLTYTTANERIQFHLNGGWSYNRLDEVHRALYGVRTDVTVVDPVQLIGEVFGEGVDMGYQVGLRWHALPDVLSIDANYGSGFSADDTGIGFAMGIAFTPSAFFRALSF